jgi:hypothetical protein
VKKIALLERRKEVERDPSCYGNSPLQAHQRRRSHSLVGRELRETNPCIYLWFASLSCFLENLICFRFDLLGCATCVCRGDYVIIYKGYSPSLVHARSQEVLEAIFVCSLWLTGLNGGGHRSDRRHLLSTARDLSNL